MVRQLDFLRKEWPSKFAEDKELRADGSFLNTIKPTLQKAKIPEDDQKQNDFAIFLGYDNVENLLVYRELLLHMDKKDNGMLQEGHGTAGTVKGAWYDYRGTSTEDLSGDIESKSDLEECKSQLLTATGVYRQRNNNRLTKGAKLHAARELIYIERLSADYILAFAKTASHPERPVLRDTIVRHLASKTIIQVKIPEKTFFQLQLSMSYFILEEASLSARSKSQTGFSLQRKNFDGSFLKMPKRYQDTEPRCVKERNIAFSVWGSRQNSWTGLCLVDTHTDDGEPLASADDLDFMDPLSNNEKPVDQPLGDPREYFLVIFGHRITIVQKSFENIVHWLEACMEEYQREVVDNLEGNKDNRKFFKWTRQMLRLLHTVREKITAILTAWENFMQPDTGDVGYFLDVVNAVDQPSQNMRLVICEITETMVELGHQKVALDLLEQQCHQNTRAFELGLNVDSEDAARYDSRRAALTIFFIFPVMAVFTLYTIPRETAPFKMDNQSFSLLLFIFMMIIQFLYFITSFIPTYSSWWNLATWLLDKFKTLWPSTWSTTPKREDIENSITEEEVVAKC